MLCTFKALLKHTLESHVQTTLLSTAVIMVIRTCLSYSADASHPFLVSM